MKKIIRALSFLSLFIIGLGCHTTKEIVPSGSAKNNQESLSHSENFYFFYSSQDKESLQKNQQVACIGFDSAIAVYYTAEYADNKYNQEQAQADYLANLISKSASPINPAKLIYVGRGVKAFQIKEDWYCPIAARIINETDR